MFILLTLAFISCSYQRNVENYYEGYYDEKLSLLKMEGEVYDGVENGIWTYYNRERKQVQKGEYAFGRQIGSWLYSYWGKDTIIVWKKVNTKKLAFSIPESFKESTLDNDTTIDTFIDSNSNVFSVRVYEKVSKNEVISYFKKTQSELATSLSIIDSKSGIVRADNDSLYLDEFKLSYDREHVTFIMYNLYAQVGNKMVVFAYSCKPEEAFRAKFFLGEIFYHTFCDKEKIIKSFLVGSDLVAF